MKAVTGYSKDDYRKETSAPIVKEFDTIAQAAAYLAEKHNASVEYMTSCIVNDANCDAIYFPDGSVVLFEME